MMDVIFDILSMETARSVLSAHCPESFHVNGYLTCAGCRVKERGSVPWSVEHVMVELQKAANLLDGR